MQAQILIVDDDPDVIKSLAICLEKEQDCRVMKAESIEEGKALFDKCAAIIDVVVADMNFGSDDPKGGLEMVRYVREKQYDYVPVIVLTGFGKKENIVESVQAGAFSYVEKGESNGASFPALVHTISLALNFRYERLQADNMARAICAMVDSHEPYTGGHCERVGEYARIVAAKYNLPAADQVLAYRAGLVHDLAMVGIDAEVLARPADLSPMIWASIRAHPIEGFNLFKDKANPVVGRAVLEHHLRIDGKGYPQLNKDFVNEQKNKGEEYRKMSEELIEKPKKISIIGQIIGLVDSFDAMTTPRPYKGRNGMKTLATALKELQEDAENGKYLRELVYCLKTGFPEICHIFRKHVMQGKLPKDLLEKNMQEGCYYLSRP